MTDYNDTSVSTDAAVKVGMVSMIRVSGNVYRLDPFSPIPSRIEIEFPEDNE